MATRTVMLSAILVGVGIHRRGGVRYARRVLADEDIGREQYTKWETEKTIADREEFRQAENLASSMRRKVGRLCTRTSFGFVLPEDREKELDELIEEIRAEAREVSRRLQTCVLSVSFLKGKIASDDREAARAMIAEVNGFLAELRQALDAADPKLIREVLAGSRGLDLVLEPSASQALQDAIQAARSAAKTIRKEVVRRGEDPADVLAALDLSAVESARMLFLELESTEQAVAVPGVDASRFVGLE